MTPPAKQSAATTMLMATALSSSLSFSRLNFMAGYLPFPRSIGKDGLETFGGGCGIERVCRMVSVVDQSQFDQDGMRPFFVLPSRKLTAALVTTRA